jgi:hypothetical protein
MNAPVASSCLSPALSPFDLDADDSYRRWRELKLKVGATSAMDLVVEVVDPAALTGVERDALLRRLARHNMAIYSGPATPADSGIARRVGAQLGLRQLDANWLADEDGVSRITVNREAPDASPRGDFIPYTDRAIRWHTDGYYHPGERQIRSMILHCVRPAATGGANALLDHEMAYIALRDLSPAHVQALMAPDALTIPERRDERGVARPAQTGPVFSVDPVDGSLHMRYTARTRSIEWKPDPATRAAVAALEGILAGPSPHVLRTTLQAGMGLVAHNVLHDRSGFSDDAAQPRLLYRARYTDRSAAPRLQW